ncbi:MAG: VacJ family lipoprotein, partial [Lentisphaeria bacterium]|nr:VacJ family lipoprotein [Lentisphaeria bacterium]
MKRFFPISLFLLLAVLLTGCATKPVIDPDDKNTGYVWTPSGVTEELAGNDPIEPFNRAMFVTNDFIMHWILRPVGYVYGSILPREGIKRIDMVSDNLAFPGR